jgi:hypothetical protein
LTFADTLFSKFDLNISLTFPSRDGGDCNS